MSSKPTMESIVMLFYRDVVSTSFFAVETLLQFGITPMWVQMAGIVCLLALEALPPPDTDVDFATADPALVDVMVDVAQSEKFSGSGGVVVSSGKAEAGGQV